MRFSFILPVALLGLVTAAPLASADMLSVPSPTLPSAFQTVDVKEMETAVKDVHVRAKPSTSSTRLATLKLGTKVEVLQLVDNNTWAQVKYGAKTGYIRADLLK